MSSLIDDISTLPTEYLKTFVNDLSNHFGPRIDWAYFNYNTELKVYLRSLFSCKGNYLATITFTFNFSEKLNEWSLISEDIGLPVRSCINKYKSEQEKRVT